MEEKTGGKTGGKHRFHPRISSIIPPEFPPEKIFLQNFLRSKWEEIFFLGGNFGGKVFGGGV